MTDLLIRIFAPHGDPPQGASPQALECRVEATLDELENFAGEATFDPQEFLKVEADAIAYGRHLRDTMLASPGLQRAYLKAAARSPVRIRLLVEAPAVAALRWERLLLDSEEEDRPAATLPQTPFSRFYQLEELPPPVSEVPRLLLAIANPELRSLTPIDVEDEVDNLLDVLKPLLDDGNLRLTIMPGRTRLSDQMTERLRAESGCTVVTGPTTLDALSRELPAVHGLHLIAHGNLSQGKAVLSLEKGDGSLAVAEEDELRVRLNQPRLRLAFLHSCKGSHGNAGLGPRLVALGVPTVIAMQDFMPMVDARRFAAAFYTTLIREGAADIAANAGRQALFRSRSANWSIPALFCRLKDARVWNPDPVRVAVQALAKQYLSFQSVRQPFPLDAVFTSGGLGGLSGGTEFALGPKLELMNGSRKALAQSKEVPRPYVLLLGPRGRAKTTHLQCLYAEAALRNPDEGAQLPLLLSLADCVPEHGAPDATIAWAVIAAFKRAGVAVENLDPEVLREAMSHRPFLFLVDGDDDIGGPVRTDALEVLTSFQVGSQQEHSILLTADDSTFDPAAPYPKCAVALIVQPMAPDRVSVYLRNLGGACAALENDLQTTRLFDLAGVPWLLGRLINNAKQDTRIKSRSDILERFVREALARLEGSAGVRNRAEQVLGRMAWRMQTARQIHLTDAEVYAIMADVRGNRDFQLQQFLEEILKKSGLLEWSGTEGVRFAYLWVQRYYCAKYLSSLPERESMRYLEDITATLGRLNRVRWWEDTLVVLAGLSKAPGPLLKKILAGSLLTEGEQVFVAARCVHEAQGAKREVDAHVREQIVDTLVWRSRDENVRSTEARKKAIEMLSLLKELRVIPHLISLAMHKVRRTWKGRREYDYSSVRLAAVQALFGMQEATLDYVVKDSKLAGNQPIQRLLQAWLRRDVVELGAQVAAQDPEVSAVAAFALGTLAKDETVRAACFEPLLQAFRDHVPESGNDDVLWAITDTLTLLDPVRVTADAIVPLLEHAQERRAPYIAYLVGRLGIAALDGPEVDFLRRSLRSDDEDLAGRALRSYAALLALQGPSASGGELEKLRDLCHQIVRNEFDDAAKELIESPISTAGRLRQQLQHQAFEALRDIGNEQSIEVLREVRQRDYDAPSYEADGTSAARSHILNGQLSFDVAEQIYWRLSGGLAMET